MKLLQRQHPKLCKLCKDPFSCSDSDEYAGYEGAIKCLLDGRGQVAFTTIEATVQLFGKLSPDLIEEYQFLCPNGAREKINYNACDWGKRPNNVWVIRPDRLQDPRRAQDRKLFYNFLEQIHFRNKVTPTRPFPPLWFDKVFVSSVNVTNIVKIVGPGGRDTMTYGEYLSEYVNSINLSTGCNKKIIRLCTSSQAELFKCLDLQKVAYSRRITPEIRCENPGYSLESCIKSVASGNSDIISLEAGDFYKAARYRGLKPIARERKNGTNIASYAVAVVRVPSEINSLQDLANASACSTGFGDISGWISPIGSLISQGLIPRETCSRSSEVSRFFRSMCVPGAGDYRYNVNVSGADVLCRLCSGDGKGGHICEKSSLELYNGETGAFRCLGERKGDVAFVSHSTPLRFTDRHTFNSNEYWATSLRSDDFRLLCSSGGQAPIKDYEKCHIAQVPSRFIVTRNNINYENYTHIVSFLSSLSEVFTGKARYSFKLFGHYEGESNLLFGDSTDSIVALDEDADYTQELGQFLPILKNMDQIACENSAILNVEGTEYVSQRVTRRFRVKDLLGTKWILFLQIERQHPKLCELCKDPFSCSDSDEYAGYEGAIKCLLDGRGQDMIFI
uniref:Transferrin-like domain-containing protein n=1 Tax=Tetranychus urticae TaxID=32264 RepID=T1KT44_TETUR